MAKHAILSPSSADRWINCPASVRMSAKIPGKPGSVYANEGTAAHELAELKTRLEILGEITSEEFLTLRDKWREEYDISDESFGAMDTHTDTYVEIVLERASLFPNSVVMAEQRVDTGIPSCWGTSDTIIVSPTHVDILDFKYGQGVPVSAEDNSQLKLYGVGALETFGDLLGDIETVYWTVVQPRLHSVQTHSVPADEIRQWRDSLIPVAELALGDEAPFGPSETACRWCPASGSCDAQLQKVFETDFEGFDPELLDGDDYADVFERIPLIKKFLNDVEKAGLERMYAEGKDIPGYKVVMSGGVRKVVDPEETLQALLQAGYTADQVSERKMLGIGALEKTLKGDFKTLLEDTGLVKKSEGRPSIAPEDDKRPAIDRTSEAVREFTEGEVL